MRKLLILLLGYFFCLSCTFATEKQPTQPSYATVGTYITHIYDINLQKKTVSVIFWLWFIYPNELVLEQNEFDIVNAERISVLYQNSKPLANNRTLKQYKIRATLYQNWSFENFPFSTKPLSIIIEDADYNAHQLIYIPDNTHSDVDHNMPLSGWRLGNDQWNLQIQHYDTNFGNASNQNNTSYARATYSIELIHTNIRMFIHIFGMLYLACFLIFGMFFVPIQDIKSRLALNSAAIFAVVGSKISTDSILPPSDTINLIDKIQLSVLIFMIITLMSVLINYHLSERNTRLAHIINIIFAILTIILIAASNYFFMTS